jgi:5-(aminomethyl)-3-furanmethanol phosphate kinase
VISAVVKLGGAVLTEGSVMALARIARDGRTLVVPGGGPFADKVRAADARFGLSDDDAHWAAILAMDQYANALAALAPGLPILAPYHWLRAVDPLPHSWDVTSDSIAAWIAHAVGAKRLLLVKPVDKGPDLVDRYFERVRGDLDVRVLGVGALASPPAWDNLSKL